MPYTKFNYQVNSAHFFHLLTIVPPESGTVVLINNCLTYFFVFNESILSWIWPLVKLLRIFEQNFCAGFVSPVVMLDVHREHLKVGEGVAYVLKIKIYTYKKVWVVRLFIQLLFCLDTRNPETSEFRVLMSNVQTIQNQKPETVARFIAYLCILSLVESISGIIQ